MKPAPIQVSWLGYPATTGVPQIDYRLTDALADPEGEADANHVQRLVRLEGGFLCYAPRYEAPEVAALPAEANGFITFGSFNTIAKITPLVIDAWPQILLAAPQSRLVLKGWMLNHAETRARIESAFAARDIEARRFTLHDRLPAAEYLDLYRQIDIGLDTFPYNGTTTFQSLWMGVPVITLRGDPHAARIRVSILTHVGLTEWIAVDVQDYIATARQLADDFPQLANIRASLRALVLQSSLCDGPNYARKIERVLRKMWCDYLSGCGN